jgi:hypothetical protein
MKKKTAASLIALAMLGCMGTGVYAGTNLQQIKAYLNPSLKFKVDGVPAQLTNEKGAVVSPITYNNTTYLPIRAVSGLLGVTVNYEASTGTVHLGEQSEGISIADGFDSQYRTKDPDKTVYKDKDYKDVFFNNSEGNRSSSFMLYPNKKYQKLYLQVAAIGKDIEQFTIKDSDADKELRQVNVSAADGLTTVEVDISGVGTLYIYGDVKDGSSMFIPLTTSYYK